MNELSLFTGGGGGVLGTQHLLGWRAVGYVEWDTYCQEVLKARIRDGVLHDAPIFGDIREFISSGCAAEFAGMVDVISAGFPCQPFSVAGKQRGADDERNMWPATIECIRVVRPRFCFLENVPGLIATGYFATVIGDLAASGYDARWRVLSAAEVGAPHKRDRLWIVAHAECGRRRKSSVVAGKKGESFCSAFGQESAFVTRPSGDDVAHADSAGICEQCGAVAASQEFEAAECGGAISDADGGRAHAEQESRGECAGASDAGGNGAVRQMADTSGECERESSNETESESVGREARIESRVRSGEADVSDGQGNGWHEGRTESEREQGRCDVAECGATYWEVDPADVAESGVGRVAYGMAYRVDRLRAIGNGQVSLVAAVAWRLLTEDLIE